MQVVDFALRHVREAAEIERLCFSEPWSEQSLAMLAEGGYGCGVALEVDGATVAYAGMVSVLDEGEIVNVATHPSYRRRGYGRAIMTALLERARDRGVRRLTLEVRLSNAAAQALYASFGFEIVGRRADFYSHPREDAIIMLRTEGD